MFQDTRSYRGLNRSRQPRLATLAGVTSLAAAISTDPAERIAAGGDMFCHMHSVVAADSSGKS